MIDLDDKRELVDVLNQLDRERERNVELTKTCANQHALIQYQEAQICAWRRQYDALRADFDFLLPLYNDAVGASK